MSTVERRAGVPLPVLTPGVLGLLSPPGRGFAPALREPLVATGPVLVAIETALLPAWVRRRRGDGAGPSTAPRG